MSPLLPDRRGAGRRGFFKTFGGARDPFLERPENLPCTLGILAQTQLKQVVDGAAELAERLEFGRCERLELSERGKRVLAKPRALARVLRLQQPQETDRVVERKSCRRNGKRCGDLLRSVEPCKRKNDGRAKEALGKDVVDLALELLEDLESVTDPAAAPAETASEPPLGELV